MAGKTLAPASGSEGVKIRWNNGRDAILLDANNVSVDFMPGDNKRQPRIEVTDLDGRVYLMQLSPEMLSAICAWANAQF